MKFKLVCICATIFASLPLLADDLAGGRRLLCASLEVTRCSLEEPCITGTPEEMNVPQFIVLDLRKEELSTTSASGENRITAIKHMEQVDGDIYILGVEGGKAFSIALDKELGKGTMAVASQGQTVTIFIACTPVPR